MLPAQTEPNIDGFQWFYNSTTSKWYGVSVTNMTWVNAALTVDRLGLEFVKIENADEDRWVLDHVVGDRANLHYIGMVWSGRQWVWRDGTVPAYTHW